MPFTLNGIGTHYYGRRNASAIQATCQSCNRDATLTSYDTRECVCVIFIPVIPLKSYRILNECSSCHRHHRIPLADFTSKVESGLAPLRAAVEKSPRDAATRMTLVSALIDYQLSSEAEKEAKLAVETLPSSPALQLVTGQLIAQRGANAEAEPYLAAAVRMSPSDSDARVSLGRALWTLQRYDEAIAHLEEAARSPESAWTALYLLADIHSRAERWPSAYSALERISQVHPNAFDDRTLASMMVRCKEKLGYPLSDQERKRGRRWFRFGGGGLRTSGSDRRRSVAIVAAVVVLCIIGVGGYGWWKSTHVDVYFDNGVGRPLQVEAGPLKLLLDGPPQLRTLPPGRHAVVVSERNGAIFENETLDIPSIGFFDAIFSDRAFIYDVAGAHVYLRQEIGYAEKESDSTYAETLIGGQRVYEVRDVDYIFTTPPQTISMDSSKRVETRRALVIADSIGPVDYATVQSGQGKFSEARSALELALRLEPCDKYAWELRTQSWLLQGNVDKALEESRSWIARCPGVEPHRIYQEIRESRGERDAVVAEYRAALDRAPQSAAAHYLYGRIVGEPAVARSEFLTAAQLDPKLPWARSGLAHSYLMHEEFAPAFAEMQTALDLEKGEEAGFVLAYALAAVGAREFERAEKTLSGIISPPRSRYFAQQGRWTLLLARGAWGEAETMLQRLSREVGAQSLRSEEMQLLELSGKSEELSRVVSLVEKEDPATAVLKRFELAAVSGDAAACALRLVEMEKTLPPDDLVTLRLYALATAYLEGNAGVATEQLARIRESVASEQTPADGKANLRLLLDAVTAARPADDVLRELRSNDDVRMLKHVYFMLGAAAAQRGDKSAAKVAFDRSAATALDLTFPYLAARKHANAMAKPMISNM